jgi:hypothetical protein
MKLRNGRSHQSRQALRRRCRIPNRVAKIPNERLVADLERVLDRTEPVIAFLEARLPDVGRNREVSIRTVLMCVMLLHRVHGHLRITDVDDLTMDCPREMLLRLGLVRPNGQYVNAKQVWRLFRRIVESLDPTGVAMRRTLSEDEETERRTALQWFTDRMIEASIPSWMTHDSGDYACDATMKWAFSKPPIRAMQRAPGNNRAGVNMASILPETMTLAESGFDSSDRPERNSQSQISRHDTDARLLGRTDGKGVFGYANHTVVRTGNDSGPILTERMRMTPATAHPAKSMTPLLQGLAEDRRNNPAISRRIATGQARALGKVSADCGYSQAVDEDWYLKIKAMGADPISRLHATNQAGLHLRHPEVTFCDGMPICECVPLALTEIRYPGPGASLIEIAEFSRKMEDRDARFGFRTNGATRRNGSRQFLAPHFDAKSRRGGCEYCVDASGTPVTNENTGEQRRRCCTKSSYVFNAKQLAQYQEPRYGSKPWCPDWGQRNRVEGSYSLVKNIGAVRWGDQDSHHYRGLAFETVIAALAIVVTNLEQVELWEIVEPDVARLPGRPPNPGLDQYLTTAIATAVAYPTCSDPP